MVREHWSFRPQLPAVHVDKAKYFKPKVLQWSHRLFHTLHPFPKLKLSKQIQVLKTPLSEEIFLNASTNMQTKASSRNTSHETYRAQHTLAVENISMLSTPVSAQTLPPLQLQAGLDDHSTFLIHKYILISKTFIETICCCMDYCCINHVSASWDQVSWLFACWFLQRLLAMAHIFKGIISRSMVPPHNL